MANPVNGINLLEQWHVAQEMLDRARLDLIREQNAHASTRDKLVDGEEYRRYATAHIADLEQSVGIIQDRMRAEQELAANLRQQLRQRQEEIRGLEDQLLLRDHNVEDIRAQIAIREQLIQRLQGEIEAIIRLKNRAIQIRDLVIGILTLALEIERENTTKAAVVSTGLTAGFFINPVWALATVCTLGTLGALKGDVHNTRQVELQRRMRGLQERLEVVKQRY